MSDPTKPALPSVAVHGSLSVSDWVRRWSHLVPSDAAVLDVACGGGRHTRWFANRGCRVTAVDRDALALQGLTSVANTLQADLEGASWPLPGASFDAVVVTNYLWRPLLPEIARSLAPSGLLIYETFARGNERYGKPSNPDFLLQSGELLGWAQVEGWQVIAYEEGVAHGPDRLVQRLVARCPAASPSDRIFTELTPA